MQHAGRAVVGLDLRAQNQVLRRVLVLLLARVPAEGLRFPAASVRAADPSRLEITGDSRGGYQLRLGPTTRD